MPYLYGISVDKASADIRAHLAEYGLVFYKNLVSTLLTKLVFFFIEQTYAKTVNTKILFSKLGQFAAFFGLPLVWTLGDWGIVTQGYVTMETKKLNGKRKVQENKVLLSFYLSKLIYQFQNLNNLSAVQEDYVVYLIKQRDSLEKERSKVNSRLKQVSASARELLIAYDTFVTVCNCPNQVQMIWQKASFIPENSLT